MAKKKIAPITNRIIKSELVEWRKLEWLQGGLKKANRDQLDRLKQSLRNNSFVQPFNVWQNGKATWILDGHHRKKAMEELAKEGVVIPDKLPANFVKCANLNDAKKLVLIYSSIYARVQDDELAALIESTEIDFELLKAEIDIPDIDLRKFEAEFITPEVVEDEIPEVPKNARTKKGDLYELGKHRLLCGDSTDSDDVAKLMDGKKARMAFTDPPYGVDYGGHGHPSWSQKHRAIQNDSLPPEQLENFWTKAFLLLSANTEGDVYSAAPPGPPNMLLAHAISASSLEHHQWLIWVKDSLVLGRSKYHYRHEHLWYGWGKGKRSSFTATRDKDSVWEIKRPKISIDHPTMKPVELPLRAIRNSSHVGDIVLDIFLGAASTLIAAEQARRICYGMELEPAYCDVAVSRYCAFTEQNKVKLNGKEIEWNGEDHGKKQAATKTGKVIARK